MKRGFQKILRLFITISLIQTIKTQYVFTQLDGIKSYDKNKLQDNIVLNLGDDFLSSQKYSLWGWFKPENINPSIQNILTLQELIGEESKVNKLLQNFPICQFTLEGLEQNQDYKDLQEVQQNPNCDYQLIQEIKFLDFLIINFDIQLDKNILSFLYINSNNQQQNNQNLIMSIQLFELEKTENNWLFFGVSADYQNGNIYFQVQTFNPLNTQTQMATLNYPTFQLKKQTRLILARSEKSDYYQTSTNSIGKIANIEMSKFFTQDLSYQWAGFLSQDLKQNNNSIELDLLFDINKNTEAVVLKNYAKENNSFPQKGNFKILNDIDQSQYGIRYYQNSNLVLNNDISFNNNDNIKSVSFFFNLKTSDNFPKKFVLLTRGTQFQDGYMQISIINTEDDIRFIRTIIKNNQQTQTFDSDQTIYKNQKVQILIGIAQGFNNNLSYFYADSNGMTKQININKFQYNMNALQLTMFNLEKNNNEFNENQYVELYRFMILNSTSPNVYFLNKKIPDVIDLTQNDIFQQEKLCQFRTSVYENFVCIKCKDSIVDIKKYQCNTYCEQGFRNFKSDICMPCNNNNNQCQNFQGTKFLIEPKPEFYKDNNRVYQIYPSNPIISGQIPYENFDYISLANNKNLKPQIEKQDNNKALLYFDISKDDLSQGIRIQQQPNGQLIIDNNRNLIQVNSEAQKIEIKKKQKKCGTKECYVPNNRLKKMRVLAYILLISYAVVAFILLIMTLIFYKKFWNLGGLWKFLLHNWMKLNLIAFFVLLAINMPRCIKEFLHQIYRFTVSWDHELRGWINDANNLNKYYQEYYDIGRYEELNDYSQGFIKRELPCQFFYEHVKPFILHNLLISFIVQLTIGFIYIVLKIWDCLKVFSKSFLFRLLVFWEYTALIVGYLLFHMRDFVFSALNIREVLFSHSYFVCCFFISILFLIVFLGFWIYATLRLLFQKNQYWSNPINVNKFYFFRVGFRDNNFARTYDLWVTLAHFLVGITIGFFIYEPLAQMIIITCVLVILFGITILLRPWKNIILLICDFITQIAILIAVIFFLVFSIQGNYSCDKSDGRNSSACWIIILFIFILFMLSLLGFLIAIFQDFLQKDVVEKVVVREDFYHDEQEYIVQNGSQKHIYPIAQDMIDNDFQENRISTLNKDTVNVNQYSTNNIQVERYTDRTINQVKTVQPDEMDEDSMQPEMFGLINDQSLRYRQSQIEMANNSKILNTQKNEFYNTLDDESKIIQNQKYQDDQNFGKF